MNKNPQKQKTSMKRKEYRKPTMKVVELQHRTMILAGSGEGKLATPSGFNPGGDPLDGDE